MKGGIARFSGLLEEALCKQGHDVIAVPFKALYPNVITKSSHVSVQQSAQLVLYNPFSWQETIYRLKLLKPDVLLVAYWTGLMAPLCFVLRRFTGIPMVVLLHNLSSHESFFFEPIMQRLLATSADGFLTLSEAVSRQVSAAIPDIPRRTLFHPAYEPEGQRSSSDEARKALNLDAQVPVLLFFGYVRHYKGLDRMLHAIPALLHREPSLRLIVAGQFYENIDRYRQLAEKLDISKNVDFYPGYVAAERTPLFFAAADAVVLPYRSATQSGVVQLAYGHGVPVIVTPVGALPEMVRHGETGWIARDVSPEGLAEVVGEFLDGREHCASMRPAIEAFRRTCSWESFAASAGSFLETIAADR